jgi:hypothetical protein
VVLPIHWQTHVAGLSPLPHGHGLSVLPVYARERCRERERERTGRVRREMEEGAERAGRLWRRVWRAELQAPTCFAASEQGVGGDKISPPRRDGGVRSEQSSERRSGAVS